MGAARSPRATTLTDQPSLPGLSVLMLLALAGASDAFAEAVEPTQCRKVQLADVGWTAESATTGIVAEILTRIGYAPTITLLTLPVTFESMRNGSIDAFLGNWMPAQAAMLQPFLEDGSVEQVRVNLEGAKYTLGVPDYLYDSGLRDFADIARFREQLDGTLYGLEPGNGGNAHVQAMIERDDFGLAGFKLVESSEQGMLAHVARAVQARQPVVFLAWAPHPMNTRFELRYLSGGDAPFGPDFGAARVHTLVRKGYLQRCPNVGRLLQNLVFTVDLEDALIDRVSSDGAPASEVARDWVERAPRELDAWLAGVRTFDGRSARDVLRQPVAAARPASPTGRVDSLLASGARFFVDGFNAATAVLLTALIAAIVWVARRS